MTTRALIGITKNGGYDVIYCLSGGAKSHLGRELLRHFKKHNDVAALVQGGDISGISSDETPHHYTKDGGEPFDDIASIQVDSDSGLAAVIAEFCTEWVYLFEQWWQWLVLNVGMWSVWSPLHLTFQTKVSSLKHFEPLAA